MMFDNGVWYHPKHYHFFLLETNTNSSPWQPPFQLLGSLTICAHLNFSDKASYIPLPDSIERKIQTLLGPAVRNNAYSELREWAPAMKCMFRTGDVFGLACPMCIYKCSHQCWGRCGLQVRFPNGYCIHIAQYSNWMIEWFEVASARWLRIDTPIMKLGTLWRTHFPQEFPHFLSEKDSCQVWAWISEREMGLFRSGIRATQ